MGSTATGLIVVPGILQRGSPWADGTPGVTQVSRGMPAKYSELMECLDRLRYLLEVTSPTISRYRTNMASTGITPKSEPITAMGFLGQS